MRLLSHEKRRAILKAAQTQSTCQIANFLNIHYSTIARIIKYANQRSQTYILGCPKKLTTREERLVIKIVSSEQWPTAVKAQQHLKNDYNIYLTARSIQNVLR